MRLDVISGVRAERAVVHVHASHWCASLPPIPSLPLRSRVSLPTQASLLPRCAVEQGLAPALPSKTRAGSAFFFSPDAVTARRERLTTFVARSAAPSVDPKEYASRLRALGEGQARLTEKALAGMLRSYSLMLK